MVRQDGVRDVLREKGVSRHLGSSADAACELAAVAPAGLDGTTEQPRAHRGISPPAQPALHDEEWAAPAEIVAFGPFRLRPAERLLEKDGVQLKLGSRALDILIALVERAPGIVSKKELLARVWPDLIVDEGSLRFQIAALRKVLGKTDSGLRYVTNVAGRGYYFAAPVWRAGAKPASCRGLRAGRVATPRHAEPLDALAGALAHDFNNILGAILEYGELAQNAASADDPVRRYVDNIMIAGRRGKSLIEGLLSFTSGGVRERIPVHAQSVVAEAVDLVSGSLPAEVRLQCALHAGDAGVIEELPRRSGQIIL
jgi:DNA-binding winged helix-turn-helix (wHTH) protein